MLFEMKRLFHVLALGVGLMVLIDASLAIYVLHQTNHARQDPNAFLRLPIACQQCGPPASPNGAGDPVSVGFASGWAVRYVAKNCPFCRQDEPRWQMLKTQMEGLGYRVYIIPPMSSDAPEESSSGTGPLEKQLRLVPIDWIKHYRLTKTPTVLVFDPGGRLIWGHEGTLKSGDPDTALQAIRSARVLGARVMGLRESKHDAKPLR